jgi:hypothetical protein
MIVVSSAMPLPDGPRFTSIAGLAIEDSSLPVS